MATFLVAGTHLVINGINGDLADKQGVASIRIPVVFPDLATAIGIANTPGLVLQALGLNTGLTCMGRPFREIESGQIQVDFSFEGLTQSQSWQEAQSLVEYRFDIEEQTTPIEANPYIAKLKQIYGWNGSAGDPPNAFPEQSPPVQQGGKALPGPTDATTGVSPAYGTTDWWRIGGTLSMSYACDSVPAAVYQGLNTIFTAPPPGAQILGIPPLKNCFWIKITPEVTSPPKGNHFRVTEKCKLCPGDPSVALIIYGQGQLG